MGNQADQPNSSSTPRFSFTRLLKMLRPVDISGELEVIEEGLPDAEAETPVITDLGPVRHWPALAAPLRLTRVQLFAGIIATVVVLSLLATGLIILPRLRPAQATIITPHVLFQAKNLGSLYQPAWGEEPAPGFTSVKCVFPAPTGTPSTNTTVPPPDCTPVAIYQGQTAPDDQYLSFVDDWGSLYTWKQGMQKPVKSITLKSGVFVGDSGSNWRWLYPGRYILSYEQTADSTTIYRIWDVIQGKLLFTTTNSLPFALAPNGIIATLTAQHTVQILDTNMLLLGNGGQGAAVFPAVPETFSSPYFANLVSLSWSSDGSLLATASSDGTIQIWEPEVASGSLQPIQALHIPATEAQESPFANITMAWSPDGTRLATSVFTNTGSTAIQIWDVQSGHLLQSHTEQHFLPMSIAWLDGGKELLAVSFNNLLLWDTTTGKTIIHTQQVITAQMQAQAQLSPNGQLLAVPQAYSIQLIDTRTGKHLHFLQSNTTKDYFVAMAFSPDNMHLAAVDIYGHIQIWNVQNGQAEMAYKLPVSFKQTSGSSPTGLGTWSPETPAGLAWSPDGKMLAVTYQGGGLVMLGME